MSDKKYNILMVSKNIPQTYKGGIQTHTYELSKQLIKNGHSVNILMSGSIFNKQKSIDENGINLIKIAYLPGRYIPVLRLFLDELFFNISAYIWILRNGNKYNLIHLQGRSGFLYSLFPKKTPYISTYHGLVSKENKSINAKNLTLQYKLFYFMSNIIEKICLKKSKNIIVVSNSLKEDIKDITQQDKNFSVISNGVNIPTFKENDNSKINIITFIGRIEKTKGVKDLIDAIETIDSKMKCVLIGDGEYKKELTEYVNSNYKLKNKVWFLGSLNSEEVSKWITVSKAVVLPSYYETQGIVLLEANSHKKPVIASNISGINEIIKNGVNGLLFEKGNVNELRIKIKILLQNEIFANTLGINGYNMVKKSYSWNTIVKETEKVYNTIA
jgi:glycosyltransferase involved in cell wall biosynthesis